MRVSVLTCLILIALVVIGANAVDRGGNAPMPPAPLRPPMAHGQEPVVVPAPPKNVAPKTNAAKGEPPTPLWQSKVESQRFAQSEEAWNDALEKATTQLRLYLLERRPSIEWRPTPEFIRSNKIVKQSEDREVTDSAVPNMPPMHQVSLQLAVTPEDLKLIQREDHKYRVEQRLWLAGRGLGGLVLLLGALAGYMRLDELTKGYFTFPLRAAALVLGVAGAAVVWFVV
ncbi:MAG: hypothetical protein ACJ8F7_21565 [Gemmataceae bacterium]